MSFSHCLFYGIIQNFILYRFLSISCLLGLLLKKKKKSLWSPSPLSLSLSLSLSLFSPKINNHIICWRWLVCSNFLLSWFVILVKSITRTKLYWYYLYYTCTVLITITGIIRALYLYIIYINGTKYFYLY